jgi:hypothetical protein
MFFRENLLRDLNEFRRSRADPVILFATPADIRHDEDSLDQDAGPFMGAKQYTGQTYAAA